MDKNTSYASVATIGIDVAKSVFQFHGVDAGGLTDGAIDADAVASGAAQELVYRHAVDFAFDIPERLIDAAFM